MKSQPKKSRIINVTPDLIIDLYLEAKNLPEKQKEKALEKIKVLSKNLYKDAFIEF